MKPFVFSLEKVLNLRRYREDEARVELGRAISILADIENRIQTYGQERLRAASEQFSQGNSMVQIQQYAIYLVRLDNTLEQLHKEAALAELKVEEARGAFLEASRERKVLDKLKEKRQKEYRKEMFAEETKILDDLPSGLGFRSQPA